MDSCRQSNEHVINPCRQTNQRTNQSIRLRLRYMIESDRDPRDWAIDPVSDEKH